MFSVPPAGPVRIAIFCLIAVLTLLLGMGLYLRNSRTPRRETVVAPDPAEDRVASRPNPGYVGPQACARCHQDRVDEFKQTRHFQAMCAPDQVSMPEGFNTGQGTLGFPDLAAHFEMRQADGQFLQTTRDSKAVSPQFDSPIAFVYGARGGNDEVYFTWQGDRLRELPMVWLAPSKSWGLSPLDRHGSGDFSRDTTLRCVECHTTWFEHVPGSRNQYGRDHNILGVTCEVCHGPGKDHVAFHGSHPDQKEPHAVVRPALLPRDRQTDLCAQCHSNALKPKGPAFSYRPGQPLSDHYVSLHTMYPEQDHVANQTTYMKQSRCYQMSDSLTCITCHNPHQPRSEANAGAQSCRKCHKNEDCADRPRLPEPVRDNCVGCHMPEHRKIQVFFRTQNDKYVAPVKRYEHKIGIDHMARKNVLWEYYRLQTDAMSQAEVDRLSNELADAWLAESRQRQQDHRFLAAIDACRESLKYTARPEAQARLDELIGIQSDIDDGYQDALWHESQGRYPEAIDAFERVLAAKPDFAMAHARLGTTYAVVGDKTLAVQHLKSAAEYDPDEPYAPGMLGWLAYLDGNAAEALDYYRQADEVEPYSAKINYQIGLALVRLQRFPEAIERFRKFATIDPGSDQAFLALSQTLRRAGKTKDSLEPALKAVSLTRFQEAASLVNLAEIYAETSRSDDALRTAEKAMSAAQSRAPRMIPQIRTLIDDIRRRQKDK